MANRLIDRLMYLHERGILDGEHQWWHEQEREFHNLNIALQEAGLTQVPIERGMHARLAVEKPHD